ncbi:hypothetical protein JGUZn3_09400 [Entomobacter blattae]|uniref:Uncharacterized protein n=1 Tax=Entomobacter blattae TaxID=2762277 RepID=A0A7H1NQW1_9PROT|nr:hypothetical protein JGUZn3_09400 [Entomobacter blattae]
MGLVQNVFKKGIILFLGLERPGFWVENPSRQVCEDKMEGGLRWVEYGSCRQVYKADV